MDSDKIIGEYIDKIFSISRDKVLLIGILLLGLILRIIAAINLTVSADDMHFVTHAINFFSSGRLITYDQSSGLWFALTSLIYQFFGVGQISSRLLALIFGTLSILAVYLLSKEFFGEKIGIISAFMLAIAPFHIKYTVAEMDVMTMFFVMFSMLIFLRAIKTNKSIFYGISGILMGLAVYTKVYPLLFIPSIWLYFIYVRKKEKKIILSKDNLKKLLIFAALVFIFTIPALTHNYLLYKDKGVLDLQFTRTLGLGKDSSAQYYSWDVQFDRKNSWKGLIFGDANYGGGGKPLIWVAINYIRVGDQINFYLGLIGIFLILLLYKKDKSYPIFFILNILFTLPFLASIILLPKHFIFLELFLVPPSALALNELISRINAKFNKDIKKYIFILLLIISSILLGLYNTGTANHFYGKSDIAQMIEFKENNIPEDSLIVGDSRIYRGRINWAFQGRPYLEGTDFINTVNNQGNLPGEVLPIKVFFFECIKDDCGWGTIKNQPEFNQTMEDLVSFFEQQGRVVSTISEPDKERNYYPFSLSGEKAETIRIIELTIPLKYSTLFLANQPKNWFLYDIGYEPVEKQFDYYVAHSVFDRLLDKIAHGIVTLSILLSLASIIYVLFLFFKAD